MLRRIINTLAEWAATAAFVVAFLLCDFLDWLSDLWNGHLWGDEED